MTLAARGVVRAPSRQWRAYPEYKDSGVEWMTEIPTQWRVQPLKAVASFVSRGNGPDYVETSTVSVINQACIHWDGLHLKNIKYQRDADVSGWKGFLRQGDLIINSTGTGTLGRVAIFGEAGVYLADSHVTIVRVVPSRYSVEYLRHLVSTPLYQGYIYSALVSGSTNQIELSREGLRATPLITPPLSEQRRIATFLDQETAKIDALIAKRGRLIELLEEKRTALISRAVTKGLDPEVPMKDSGADWLGEIPGHWKLRRAKQISSIFVPQRNKPLLNPNEGLPWITMDDLGSTSLDRSVAGHRVSSSDALNAGSRTLPSGSVVVSCVGNFGVSSVSTVPVVINQQLQAYMAPHINPWYLRHLVYISKPYFEKVATTTTLTYVNQERFGDLPVPVPPTDEQAAIVAHIGHKTGSIDNLIDKVRYHVEKLREYRSALISAAVTGKIDVREEVREVQNGDR